MARNQQNFRPDTLDEIIEEGHRDPVAVTVLATALARDWCDKWGGWDACSMQERIGQVWACRPQARKLLAAMKKLSRTDRAPLAQTLRAA